MQLQRGNAAFIRKWLDNCVPKSAAVQGDLDPEDAMHGPGTIFIFRRRIFIFRRWIPGRLDTIDRGRGFSPSGRGHNRLQPRARPPRLELSSARALALGSALTSTTRRVQMWLLSTRAGRPVTSSDGGD